LIIGNYLASVVGKFISRSSYYSYGNKNFSRFLAGNEFPDYIRLSNYGY
jgi:hypothetical protein